jgi:hypothetical protein
MKRAINLFQRLITFSSKLSDADLATFSGSLYTALGHYGLACCQFMSTNYEKAANYFLLSIASLEKYLSNTDLVSDRLTLVSQDMALFDSLHFWKHLNISYDTDTALISTVLINSATASETLFASCLPLRCNPQPTPTSSSSSHHYSLLFDSYNWVLFCTLRFPRVLYSQAFTFTENFQLWIEKYSELLSRCPLPDSDPSWQLERQLTLHKLSLANLVVRCRFIERIELGEEERERSQEAIYSQLLHHTQAISRYFSTTAPNPIVVNFSSLVCWDCSQLYYLIVKYFFDKTKLRSFCVEDENLFNENYRLSHVVEQVVEIASLGLKETEKTLRRLVQEMEKMVQEVQQEGGVGVLEREERRDMELMRCNQLLTRTHETYIRQINIHVHRGLCAPDRIQAQRYFECGHTSREEYDRLVTPPLCPLLILSSSCSSSQVATLRELFGYRILPASYPAQLDCHSCTSSRY